MLSQEIAPVTFGLFRAGEAEFTLTLAPDISPMGYHMTAYAVQNLAVTTARRHFGVVPVSGSGR